MALYLENMIPYLHREDNGNVIPGVNIEYRTGGKTRFCEVEAGRVVCGEFEGMSESLRRKLIDAAEAYVLLDEFGLFSDSPEGA